MPIENEGLDISLTAPFEQLATKLLEVWERARANMDPELRKEWDAEGLRLYRVSIGFVVRQIEKAQGKS